MSTQSHSDAEPQKGESVILDGNTFKIPYHNLSFHIPQAWVEWVNQYPDKPNIHLTAEQLKNVKDAEGEWDHEYALILNEALPFSSCLLHAGSEGWGLDGTTYTDLQMRVYVVESSVHETANAINKKASQAVEKVSGQIASPQTKKFGPWQNIRFDYDLKYEDYGATAEIDLYLQPSKNATIVFAFMHTLQPHLTDEKMSILNSVEFYE